MISDKAYPSIFKSNHNARRLDIVVRCSATNYYMNRTKAEWQNSEVKTPPPKDTQEILLNRCASNKFQNRTASTLVSIRLDIDEMALLILDG